MILLDTSGLLAFYHATDALHRVTRSVVLRERDRILSPLVLAELDYLITQRIGRQASRTVIRDVSNGAYRLESMSTADIALAGTIIDRYADLAIGLTDASIMVLAERYGCYDILTLDQRHFRSVTSTSGRAFRLLPLDE